MTESEAIKTCNTIGFATSFSNPQGIQLNTTKEELKEAIRMSIQALEKQIPKKPYIQQDDRNNDCLECPSCDSFIGYEYDCRDEHYQINYCPCCGQAIDWSDEE